MQQNKNQSEAFEILKEYLIQNHNAKAARGGREIIKRCHICGDSRDPSDAHMYIGMKNGVIVYNCFKCNNSGVVDGNFLRSIDCYDPNILNLVKDQNQSASSNNSYFGIIKRINRSKLFIPISNNEYAIKKLDYLNNRLGYDFTLESVTNYRIILNLKDFLDANRITQYTRDPGLVDLLDKFFIGFLTFDNSYVILRRLVPEGKLPEFIDTRYMNYNIFNNKGGDKLYSIPSVLNINSCIKPSLYIAEGCFDILSIAKRCEKQNSMCYNGGNNIFFAVCGKSYISVIRFIIMNFGITNMNIHIYPDNDVADYEMQKIVNELNVYQYINVFVHRNIYPGEKDFGVAEDHIEEVVTRIK